jgi:hypothetical protein
MKEDMKDAKEQEKAAMRSRKGRMWNTAGE